MTEAKWFFEHFCKISLGFRPQRVGSCAEDAKWRRPDSGCCQEPELQWWSDVRRCRWPPRMLAARALVLSSPKLRTRVSCFIFYSFSFTLNSSLFLVSFIFVVLCAAIDDYLKMDWLVKVNRYMLNNWKIIVFYFLIIQKYVILNFN